MSNTLYCGKCADRYKYPTDTCKSAEDGHDWRCVICGSHTQTIYVGVWHADKDGGGGYMQALNTERNKPLPTPIRELVQRRMRQWDGE